MGPELRCCQSARRPQGREGAGCGVAGEREGVSGQAAVGRTAALTSVTSPGGTRSPEEHAGPAGMLIVGEAEDHYSCPPLHRG